MEPEPWTAGPKAGWIVCDTDRACFRCHRCDVEEPFVVPVRVLSDWVAAGQQFVRAHQACRARAAVSIQEALA